MVDAGEGFQVAKRIVIQFAARLRNHVVEGVEDLFGSLNALALDALGHHGSRGPGDGATGALESNVVDDPIDNLEIEAYLVAAQRVVPVSALVRFLDLSEVPGFAVVLQEDLLVQIAKAGH